jgi:hypothetical protein
MALLVLPLWPGWVEVEARARRRTAAAAAAAVLVLCGAVAALPASSAEHPTWLDLRYILDADADSARWEAFDLRRALAGEPARRLRRFARATKPPFPWLSLDPSMHVAPAPVWNAARPEIEVLSSEPGADARRVRARIRSARGAPRLHLRLPPEAELTAVRWNQSELTQEIARIPTQIFFAVPAEGLEIELKIRGQAPVRLWLLDQDWALPDEMRALQAARPASCVPRSDGDVSVLGRSFEL